MHPDKGFCNTPSFVYMIRDQPQSISKISNRETCKEVVDVDWRGSGTRGLYSVDRMQGMEVGRIERLNLESWMISECLQYIEKPRSENCK